MKIPAFLAVSFCFLCLTGFAKPVHAALPDSGTTVKTDLWAYNILNIIRQKAVPGKVLRVAVVDDGFRLTHKSIKDFIFTNEKEVPGNFQDDDQNGYPDDIHGWDISDNDNDVSVPKGKEEVFYHGTYISGVITGIFRQCFGEEASKYLKIIPVKVLSSNAKSTYLADGYKGLKYACDLGADIVCCAWSGGFISEEDKAVISRAVSKGTIIVGSAGNFFTEKVELPSSLPGVFCVAAIDSSMRKEKYSNYGMRIDFSAPGSNVYGPVPLADNSYSYEEGTSPAAAIIAGCAAILKALNPGASSREILDALVVSSRPVDSLNTGFCGKLGSGLPDMAKAINFITDPEVRFTIFNPFLPKGRIFYQRKKSPMSWEIKPSGAYKGIHLYSTIPGSAGQVKIYGPDTLFYSGAVANISNGIFLPGSRFRIELQPGSKLSKQLEFSYYMETIDSTTLYCKDIQYLNAENGIITDNSGNENYANNCSCKWQIKVSEGKRIRIEFEEIDTEPNVDYVWFFEGTSTLQENLLAKFSGKTVPPVIITTTNQVLIWFLTDSHTVGKGWKMRYTAIE